jgi:hypothetical protein
MKQLQKKKLSKSAVVYESVRQKLKRDRRMTEIESIYDRCVNTKHNYRDIIEPLLVTHDLWTSDNLSIGKALLDVLSDSTIRGIDLLSSEVDPNYCTANQYKEIKAIEKDIDKYEGAVLEVFDSLYKEAKETISRLIARHIDPASNVIYIVVLPPTFDKHVCLNKKILVKYDIAKKDIKELLSKDLKDIDRPILSIGTIDEYKDYLKSLLDKYQSTTFQDHISEQPMTLDRVRAVLDRFPAVTNLSPRLRKIVDERMELVAYHGRSLVRGLNMVKHKLQHVTTEDLETYAKGFEKMYESIIQGIPMEIEPLKVESGSGWAKADDHVTDMTSQTICFDDM